MLFFKGGGTAVHTAAMTGYLEIATILISKGCDVNITTNVKHI